MNDHIIQAYMDNITQHFGVSQEFILSKGGFMKKTHPRNLFYYLCSLKGIPIVCIQSFLEKNDFYMHHSTILQGVQKISRRIEGDLDYIPLIKKLKNIRVNV